jgi:hypothetical protein
MNPRFSKDRLEIALPDAEWQSYRLEDEYSMDVS